MTETQQRFLKAISERVTTGEIEEVRLFPTVRSGPLESGVAIVAVRDLASAVPAGDAPGDEVVGVSDALAGPGTAEPADEPVALETRDDRGDRLSILTARFRQTVKGPERGRWEFDIVHDADAPLETIERVVRGVAHRAGEDGEPELLTGDAFRRALSEPWWTAQQA
jgi:hypothetical protein